jgi:hypothetical protein
MTVPESEFRVASYHDHHQVERRAHIHSHCLSGCRTPVFKKPSVSHPTVTESNLFFIIIKFEERFMFHAVACKGSMVHPPKARGFADEQPASFRSFGKKPYEVSASTCPSAQKPVGKVVDLALRARPKIKRGLSGYSSNNEPERAFIGLHFAKHKTQREVVWLPREFFNFPNYHDSVRISLGSPRE